MKILPPTWLLITLVLMLVFHFAIPVAEIVQGVWRLAGLLPLLAGIVLELVADGEFQRARTTVRPGERPSALVTHGAYNISRNPMYLGFVIILLGIAVLLGSLSPFILLPAFALLIDRSFIRMEEQSLLAAFEGAWLAYRRRVRRWL